MQYETHKRSILKVVSWRIWATNIHWQTVDIDKNNRKDFKACIFLITDLFGVNKSTITKLVENIPRVGETAKLFVDAGLIVLVSFISPFKSERDMAREMVENDEFYEVYVSTLYEVC